MRQVVTDTDLEALNESLDDPTKLEEYKGRLDDYHVSFLPQILGALLVWCGTIMYGEKPSYLKFRSVEIIARVPYHSWSSALYTLLTVFYSDEHRARVFLNTAHHARRAQDNETMHLVVISHLAEKEEHAGFIRHTLIPIVFAFFYFWASYILYLLKPRWSYELNFLFESHAFSQYDRFITEHEVALKSKPVASEFLAWYGRNPKNQYELFRSIRNDEIIHRNQSIEETEAV